MHVVNNTLRTLRYVWASPYSLVGLLFSVPALLLGAEARVNAGTLEVAGGRFGLWLARFPRLLRFSAVTIGHVVLGQSHELLASVRAHERVHVRQYEHWGPLFVPLYCGASMVQLLLGHNPRYANRFEREAYSAHPPVRT